MIEGLYILVIVFFNELEKFSVFRRRDHVILRESKRTRVLRAARIMCSALYDLHSASKSYQFRDSGAYQALSTSPETTTTKNITALVHFE